MQKLCDIISVLLEVLESTPGVLEVGGRKRRRVPCLCLTTILGHTCPGEEWPGSQSGSYTADSAPTTVRQLTGVRSWERGASAPEQPRELMKTPPLWPHPQRRVWEEGELNTILVTCPAFA